MASNRRPWSGIGLGLCVMTLAVYAPVWRHEFVEFDDPVYVVQCPLVQGGLNGRGIVEAFTTFRAGNWHPLTWLSLMADRQLFGNSSSAFHLTNLVLHLANTLLLFAALTRMTGAVWRSALVAALFAVHPLHVESVAWVSERKDVFSTLFWMLVLLCYCRYAQKPSPAWYLAACACFVMGLLAKPMLVTLPFVLLLLDYWPLNRIQRSPGGPAPAADADERKNANSYPSESSPGSNETITAFTWPRAVAEKTPFLFLAIAASAVTLYAQSFSVAALASFPLPNRLSNAVTAYVQYLIDTIWPAGLACFYPWRMIEWSSIWPLAATFFLIGVTVMVMWRKQSPWLLVGWLWYLGTLVPVIGLVQVGKQSHADRYTYIPLVGIFIMAAWSIPANAFIKHRTAMTVIVAGTLGTLMVVSWKQVGYWHDTRALFERDLAATGGNAVAHVNLGVISQEAGRISLAEKHYHDALRFNPNFEQPHTLLADIAESRGDLASATEHCRAAIRLNPNVPDPYAIYGITLAKQGNFRSAIDQFRRAVRLAPESYGYRFNLALALASAGELPQAVEEFRSAIRLQPNAAVAYQQLAFVLQRIGQTDEAREQFRKAVQLDPRLAEGQRESPAAP